MSKTVTFAIVGDKNVGKSCVLISYVTYAFPPDIAPSTLGLSINKNVDGNNYNIEFSEVGDYDVLPKADVFLIVYSVTTPSTLDSVQSKWVPNIKNNAPDVPFILVANKIDMRDDPASIERLAQKGIAPITTEHGRSKSKEIGAAAFIECSALTMFGLHQAFDEAIRQIHTGVGGKGKAKTSSKSKSKKSCEIL
ncbi:Rho family GTPase [Heterostelium album PN500]|uniref:Rho family GTPase n=1 Tax=Heterostelium pallidum (strain ATCC 26659 / Pp 5 / PN500) TaxID=670386 RepID=D3B3Q4_HETP5|nr:Rho family GTPase [Heterostelium album PN500]EFA83952.1 Rho family GTPase [Heterostelium album PN500]|eukprot:XP_020436069.1 Rho family GTPase [Heterostelium album PN500]